MDRFTPFGLFYRLSEPSQPRPQLEPAAALKRLVFGSLVLVITSKSSHALRFLFWVAKIGVLRRDSLTEWCECFVLGTNSFSFVDC